MQPGFSLRVSISSYFPPAYVQTQWNHAEIKQNKSNSSAFQLQLSLKMTVRFLTPNWFLFFNQNNWNKTDLENSAFYIWYRMKFCVTMET